MTELAGTVRNRHCIFAVPAPGRNSCPLSSGPWVACLSRPAVGGPHARLILALQLEVSQSDH